MRRDYVVAILLAVAGLAGGLVLMVAPMYLKLSEDAIEWCFRGGLAFTGIFILLAIWVALGHKTPGEIVNSLEKTALPLPTPSNSGLDAMLRSIPEIQPRKVFFGNEAQWRSAAEFTNLSDAVQLAFNEAEKNNLLFAAAARGVREPRSPVQVLNYIGTYLITKELRIFGCKAPSTEFKEIDPSEVRKCQFHSDQNILRDKMYPLSIYWTDAAVKTAELNAFLPKIKDRHKADEDI